MITADEIFDFNAQVKSFVDWYRLKLAASVLYGDRAKSVDYYVSYEYNDEGGSDNIYHRFRVRDEDGDELDMLPEDEITANPNYQKLYLYSLRSDIGYLNIESIIRLRDSDYMSHFIPKDESDYEHMSITIDPKPPTPLLEGIVHVEL